MQLQSSLSLIKRGKKNTGYSINSEANWSYMIPFWQVAFDLTHGNTHIDSSNAYGVYMNRIMREWVKTKNSVSVNRKKFILCK